MADHTWEETMSYSYRRLKGTAELLSSSERRAQELYPRETRATRAPCGDLSHSEVIRKAPTEKGHVNPHHRARRW